MDRPTSYNNNVMNRKVMKQITDFSLDLSIVNWQQNT